MATVHFLGTCSGTEPMEGTHHCSLIFEIGDALYWFDAGENAAHRAYTSGIPVLRTKALFISHAHIDHIGGLANLLSMMNKVIRHYDLRLAFDNTLDLFFPDMPTLEGVKIVCNGWKNKDRFRFNLIPHEIDDGVLYEDERVRVSALHNQHLKEDGSEGWHAWSYLLEFEGKRAVFSGDVRRPEELDPFVEHGCDFLIMETGHHKVADVCEYARSRGVKTLRFNHHGREILNHREEMEAYVADFAKENGMSIVIAKDGMDEEI